MNNNDRELLSDIKIHIEYIRTTVTSLDDRVRVQNGRVNNNEKGIQHLTDTIPNKINNAITKHQDKEMTKTLSVMGAVVAIITLIINLTFKFLWK